MHTSQVLPSAPKTRSIHGSHRSQLCYCLIECRRYKVYVGQTCSLRRRFHQDYRGPKGSHLKPFFDEALANGCEIWRRCKYTARTLSNNVPHPQSCASKLKAIWSFGHTSRQSTTAEFSMQKQDFSVFMELVRTHSCLLRS